ncbi:hypothetical protein BDQ12DRAFT_684318 [Crucibulum laeve]|uniref:Uncharacterized protein n=1 Tax=Crucibulum laeve TaxID=68775 RepID=A0A5C3M0K6_9AGAR|nr:hypothetical protein BDQ12DRAFT_684318 [Crucibulum laeve]
MPEEAVEWYRKVGAFLIFSFVSWLERLRGSGGGRGLAPRSRCLLPSGGSFLSLVRRVSILLSSSPPFCPRTMPSVAYTILYDRELL